MMHALDMLREYDFARQALVSGLAIGSVCSLLSVVVVLKRMAFIGQGISHAGFGGIGTAIFLGLAGLSQDAVVLGFCLATGVAIGILSRRRQMEADTAIGVLLVAAMAWGAILQSLRVVMQSYPWYVRWFGAGNTRSSVELLLSGSLLSASAIDMWVAVILSLAVILVMAAFYKEIVFFTFDEPVSQVFGVPTKVIYYLLLVLLSITIVLSIRMVGIVLVSALLVIPGATGLMLSRRLASVLVWSWVVGILGTAGGLLVSLQVGSLPTGPCIVGALCLLFGLAFFGRPIWLGWRVPAAGE